LIIRVLSTWRFRQLQDQVQRQAVLPLARRLAVPALRLVPWLLPVNCRRGHYLQVKPDLVWQAQLRLVLAQLVWAVMLLAAA
jgi:hypothetical protein